MTSRHVCFACAKPLGKNPGQVTVMGETTRVFVGSTCFKLVQKYGAEGYQPPMGGPKLIPLIGEPWLRSDGEDPTEAEILSEVKP